MGGGGREERSGVASDGGKMVMLTSLGGVDAPFLDIWALPARAILSAEIGDRTGAWNGVFAMRSFKDMP